MNKEFERYLIVFLLLMLIGLSGCIKKKILTSDNPKLPDTVLDPTKEEKMATQMDTVSKMESIANALGCMFAPDTCQAKKDLGTTEDK